MEEQRTAGGSSWRGNAVLFFLIFILIFIFKKGDFFFFIFFLVSFSYSLSLFFHSPISVSGGRSSPAPLTPPPASSWPRPQPNLIGWTTTTAFFFKMISDMIGFGNGIDWVSLSLTPLYWVLLGFTWFCLFSPSFTGFNWVFTGFNWV